MLKVDYSSYEGFLEDYEENICQGETMIRSHRRLDVGEELQLALSFPGLLEPIKLEGRVSWVRQDDGEIGYGIQFFRDRESWSALDPLVERIRAGDERLLASMTLHVLIVEDNQHVADLVRRGLQEHLQRSRSSVAFEIDHVTNGLEALKLLESSYDLLMVDIFLPLMDGEQLITKVRSWEEWDSVPIIAFSAEDEEVRERVLDAGADFFLPKPLRLVQLLDTMNRLTASNAQLVRPS